MTKVKTTGIDAEMTSNPNTNTKNDMITNTHGNANDEKSNTNNAMDYTIVDTQEISSITERCIKKQFSLQMKKILSSQT